MWTWYKFDIQGNESKQRWLTVSNPEIQNNETGTYQIATMSDSGILYRLDTRTGDIVRIKKSNIPKVDIYKK